jgi:cell shape-determining protein MreD
MATLVASLSLLIAVIFQTTIVVRVNILHGSADLVLLTLVAWVIYEQSNSNFRWGLLAGLLVGIASALPFWLEVIEYTLVVTLLGAIKARVWQAPLLLLFSSVFLGTFIINSMDFFYLWITGVPLNIDEVFNLVVLPSLVLNVILALPTYSIMGELAKKVYPPEVEV